MNLQSDPRDAKAARNAASGLRSIMFQAPVIIIGVGAMTVVRFRETFTANGLRVAVDVPPHDGGVATNPAIRGEVTRMVVDADGLNPVSTTALVASILVAALTWIGVTMCIMLLARRFVRGEFFTRATSRLLDAAVWITGGGALGTLILDTFTRNGVLALIDPDGRLSTGSGLSDAWYTVLPYAPAFAAVLAVGMLAAAFPRGAQLQHDTRGLV